MCGQRQIAEHAANRAGGVGRDPIEQEEQQETLTVWLSFMLIR